MNPLVVSVTSVKFKFAFLHASWAVNILRELLRIWSDRKSFNGLNFLQDIYIKLRETELVEISSLPRVCKNAEMNLKSTTTNGFKFPIINSLMASWGVRLTWLDCNFLCIFFMNY